MFFQSKNSSKFTLRLRVFGSVVAVAAIAIEGGIAQAQPDINNNPHMVEPHTVQPPAMTLAEILNFDWANAKPDDMMKVARSMARLTPEQRQQVMGKQQDQNWRNRISKAGFTEAPTQDAILAFIHERDAAREPLKLQVAQAQGKLRDKGLPDADVKTQIETVKDGVTKEQVRSTAALKKLDGQISYSTKPRLEAFLMFNGFLDNGESLLNGIMGGMAATNTFTFGGPNGTNLFTMNVDGNANGPMMIQRQGVVTYHNNADGPMIIRRQVINNGNGNGDVVVEMERKTEVQNNPLPKN